MLLKRPERELIYKCQDMLRDERRLPYGKRDHTFVRVVLDTIAQLKMQQRGNCKPLKLQVKNNN